LEGYSGPRLDCSITVRIAPWMGTSLRQAHEGASSRERLSAFQAAPRVRRGGAVLLLGRDPAHAMASVSFRLFASPRSPRVAALDPPGLHWASSTMAMRARPQDRVASGWTWGRRTASFSCVVKDPSSDVRVIRPRGAEDRCGGEWFNYYRLSHHYYECWISDRLQSVRSTTQGHQVVVRPGGLTGPRCKPRCFPARHVRPGTVSSGRRRRRRPRACHRTSSWQSGWRRRTSGPGMIRPSLSRR
jgi:hypothetical protein